MALADTRRTNVVYILVSSAPYAIYELNGNIISENTWLVPTASALPILLPTELVTLSNATFAFIVAAERFRCRSTWLRSMLHNDFFYRRHFYAATLKKKIWKLLPVSRVFFLCHSLNAPCLMFISRINSFLQSKRKSGYYMILLFYLFLAQFSLRSRFPITIICIYIIKTWL